MRLTPEVIHMNQHGPKPKLSTTLRGYGSDHRRGRAAALEDLRLYDGQPCPHCSQPIWWTDREQLDYDHTDDRTGYRGLAHATCNRRAGQAKAMRIRAAQKITRSRNW